ncbi:hypothetical protein N7510_006836 [Penicillium lagena]|uniref:uncharacterized protein n=1 Tax=Penicillium lagena TaxID=94218 RepID=UPI002540B88A|nr:uncharacterized protein N7510_006836 [Penicillium lagena]KAJ5610117.1 hypothetical protein N7510_006836 [Penicillium lagena]
MAPTIYPAKLTLPCPLFAADFDPRDNRFLLVGGGGGQGRSGVLLDTSKRDEIKQSVELELSRDEDSVTSLAAAPQSGNANEIIALAGINSSVEQVKKNNNQHLRSFRFDAPHRELAVMLPPTDSAIENEAEDEKETKKEEARTEGQLIPGKATPLSQASLFKIKGGADSADTYQRVLRLSPWRKNKGVEGDDTESARIAAITTGLAPSGEIVFFHATETPSESDVVGRIRLSGNEEAEDLDFANLENDKFRVAYTTGVDVVIGEISSSKRSNAAPDVKTIFSIPLPKSGTARPKFRALRFLNPTTLLLLQNAPDRGGAELVLLRLPDDKTSKASILSRKRLPRSVKIGLGLDVCPLGTNPQGQQQTIIAASGSDNSIALFTLEFGPVRGFGPIRPFTVIRDVHPFSMTKLVFSTFIAPAHPVGPEVPPQNVKLASVSMGNTVVVHTIPPLPLPSSVPHAALRMFLLSLVAILAALQSFAEVRGLAPSILGARDYVGESWTRPYIPDAHGKNHPILERIFPALRSAPALEQSDQLESLRQILDRVHAAGVAPVDLDIPSPKDLSVIVRCDPRVGESPEHSVIVETAQSAHLIPSSKEDKLRAWKELSASEQRAWKQRLTHAGRWAAGEGESVLQGVLFSETCGKLGDKVKEKLS